MAAFFHAFVFFMGLLANGSTSYKAKESFKKATTKAASYDAAVGCIAA